nr:hypothetical protein [Tanacetum cinerariifolium]
EDASKQERKIDDIDQDDDITLVNDQDDAKIFDVNDLQGEDLFVEKEVAHKEVSAAGEVNAASIATTVSAAATITTKEITLAQSLMEIKTTKPKAKVVLQELSEDASKQERKINDIDQDDDITLSFQKGKHTVDFRTKLVDGISKRAGEELTQESAKKKKVEDDKETSELKQLMEIIPNEEEVAIDDIPLSVNSPRIVDWKIYKDRKKSYYQIIRADKSSKMYMFFRQMVKSFDREDLKYLYTLVKAKYGSTRPVEDIDLLLLGAEPSKPKKIQNKSDSAILSEETSSKKKPAKAKKDVTLTKKPSSKPKSNKKKAPVKADRGKSLNVFLEVALSEAAQLKEATKQSKKDFHISHASGSGDGTDFELEVPNEQQRKISGID